MTKMDKKIKLIENAEIWGGEVVCFSLRVDVDAKTGKKKTYFPKVEGGWNKLKESRIELNSNHNAIAILTGEVNGIVVVDFDGEKGMAVYERFKEELGLTFVETSTRGFKHAYFIYDEMIKPSTDIKKTYDIDILSDNKCCFIGDSHNGMPVGPMPIGLKRFLFANFEELQDFEESDELESYFEEIDLAIDNSVRDIRSLMDEEDGDMVIDNKIKNNKKNIKFSITKEKKMTNLISLEENNNLFLNKKYEPVDKVVDLVKLIPKKHADDRESWIKIGICVKNLLEKEGEAFGLWDEFSQLSKKYKSSEIFNVWSSLKFHDSSSIGILYNYAKDGSKKKLKEWSSKHGSQRTPVLVGEVKILNKFDLDDRFDFNKLQDYLIDTVFEDEQKAVEYLESNLYRVCVKVKDEMIVKKFGSEFDNVHSFETYNIKWRQQDKVKFKYIDDDGKQKVMRTSLMIFVFDQYSHVLNKFDKINNDFIRDGDVRNDSTNEFYISEGFKARYLRNLSTDLQDEGYKMILPLLDMIKVVYCGGNDGLYELLMKLFSFWVVNPNEKSGKCLMLTGSQGTGKSTIVDFFSEFIFGRKLCIQLKGFKELLSDKNGHMSGKKLCNVNEASSKKGDYFTNFNDLKTLISDQMISVRAMYKNTRNEKSSTEMVITTNNANCCPVEDNDRKYIILKVSDIYMQKDSFWTPFRAQIFNQQAADVFYTYLLNMNITPQIWNSTDFKSLDTELKKELSLLNKNSVELFILDLREQLNDEDSSESSEVDLKVSYINIKDEKVFYDLKKTKDVIKIKSSSLYDAYKGYCRQNGEKCNSSKYFSFECKNTLKIDKVKIRGIDYLKIVDTK